MERQPIHIDPSELLEAINRRAAYSRSEEEVVASLIVHRMVYEDDLMIPEACARSLERCFEFLGVPSEPVFTDLVRGVNGHLSSHIVNYDEIAAALKGTPHEQWLDDPAYK